MYGDGSNTKYFLFARTKRAFKTNKIFMIHTKTDSKHAKAYTKDIHTTLTSVFTAESLSTTEIPENEIPFIGTNPIDTKATRTNATFFNALFDDHPEESAYLKNLLPPRTNRCPIQEFNGPSDFPLMPVQPTTANSSNRVWNNPHTIYLQQNAPNTYTHSALVLTPAQQVATNQLRGK